MGFKRQRVVVHRVIVSSQCIAFCSVGVPQSAYRISSRYSLSLGASSINVSALRGHCCGIGVWSRPSAAVLAHTPQQVCYLLSTNLATCPSNVLLHAIVFLAHVLACCRHNSHYRVCKWLSTASVFCAMLGLLMHAIPWSVYHTHHRHYNSRRMGRCTAQQQPQAASIRPRSCLQQLLKHPAMQHCSHLQQQPAYHINMC